MKYEHYGSAEDRTYTDTPDVHLVEGFDPEVAEDLGIPTDVESSIRHSVSGLEVMNAYPTPRQIQLLKDQAEHAALSRVEGEIRCADCCRPGCKGNCKR